MPQSGVFEPVVLHADGVTLVTPDNPAKANEVVVIYATGSGQLLNGPLTGIPAPFPPNDWLAVALPDVSYLTDQTEAVLTVQYSGLAAGFVGLWQLNIRMPSPIPPGVNGSLRIIQVQSFQRISFPLTE